MNPKYKVSNTPGNKSKGRYLTSCLAVFASKATQDGSVDRLTLSSSSVLSLSSVPFSRYPSTAPWLHFLFHTDTLGSAVKVGFVIFIFHSLVEYCEEQ